MLTKLSNVKHTFHVIVLLFIIFFIEIDNGALKLWYTDKDMGEFDPIVRYGVPFFWFLYILRWLTLLSLPQFIFNFCGLVFYNAYTVLPETIPNQDKCPQICFRTVTRGDFPDLVRRNVLSNLSTCQEAGLKNFCIEIASDKAFDFPYDPNIRLIVTPKDYVPKSGTLYKARALQYCLEEGVSPMKDDEWIVHLDEETLITHRSLCGIVKFVMSDKHCFGQGVITYGSQEVVNWWTTLADAIRVAEDYGKLRFQFKIFHKPIFSWKGSYVVTKVKAEKDVSFDNGLDGCVAEDCYFGMIAFQKGYSFDFIEGEMWEKSPFTIMDMLHQRKRWFQGIYLVVRSKHIQTPIKFFLSMSLYAWMTMPIGLLNVYFAISYPLPAGYWVNFLSTFIGAETMFMYMFGTLKSIQYRRIGVFRYILFTLTSLLTIPFNAILESVAVLWGLFTEKHVFFVVQKQNPKLTSNAVSEI